MSLVSGNDSHPNTDHEYWEFVHCAVCFLPFAPDPTNVAVPPSIPFWLTECGHTICNNHLNADQSCAPCGAPSIQLVPLQRDMIPPMSGWFRSVPHTLDDIAHAAKFQQENMASLVRFYKRKCAQQHATISKAKAALAENTALRSQIEQLQRENVQLRAAAGVPENRHPDQRFAYESNRHATSEAYEPGASRNANGKRPLDINRNQRTSSPRSVVTPLAPPRLTLPPDRQQPAFQGGMGGATGGGEHAEESSMRPGSSRFAQYAFQPPETPLRAQSLRHQQQPQNIRGQQQLIMQENHQQVHAHREQYQRQQQQQHPHQHQMLPPPTPARTHGTTVTSQHQTTARGPFRPAGQSSVQRGRNSQIQMPPPAPAPHQPHPSNGRRPQPFPMAVPDTARVSTAQSSSVRLLSTSNMDSQFRAVPQTPSNRFFAGSTSGVPSSSRAQGTASGGSTRAQFVPGRG